VIGESVISSTTRDACFAARRILRATASSLEPDIDFNSHTLVIDHEVGNLSFTGDGNENHAVSTTGEPLRAVELMLL
jgi:hypothetical protein